MNGTHPVLERARRWFVDQNIEPYTVITLAWRGTIDVRPPIRCVVPVLWDTETHSAVYGAFIRGCDAYLNLLRLVIGLELSEEEWPREAYPDLSFDEDAKWVQQARHRHEAYHIELEQRDPRYKEYVALRNEETALQEAECQLQARRQAYLTRLAAFAQK